ncbi:M15 family metallopeptidase [Halioxenophilus sp. WMMB6]|uniref:M15 family metallopeptidase n=1 Tax=Halioxenophilus sp. WMMB6 TaxID=3073815 RepID=UPI00295F29AD|nr:M15 family metallopeptidase [Halioxenophilus sp. WMMB6]
MAPALKILADAAKESGFELAVVSAFRSFDQQLAIWNAKACGKRAVLDVSEYPIPPGTLNGWPLVEAILRWSALPGASRHHWGTDMDVYDRAAMPAGYQVQLTQAEAEPNGVFGAFHQWLSRWLDNNPDVGFYRPYVKRLDGDCRPFGIAPEPWHLSFRPLSQQLEAEYDLTQLARLLETSDIQLKAPILEHLEEIYQRFIKVC